MGTLLYIGIVLLVIALIAYLLGARGVAGMSAGLGKTFLAGELIAEATKRDRQRALVLAPAALKDTMWVPFLRTWNLYSTRVEVISYDELRLADDDRLAELDEYALVVVDEAHNNVDLCVDLRVVLLKEKGKWKIKLMHSTRIIPPKTK